MAGLADNNGYFAIDGFDLSDAATEVEVKHNGDVVETTCGFGATYKTRTITLKDSEISWQVAYKVGEVPDWWTKFLPGDHTAEFGPESNVAGKPRHLGNYVLSDLEGLKKTIAGDLVILSGTMMGNGAPTVNLFEGATY